MPALKPTLQCISIAIAVIPLWANAQESKPKPLWEIGVAAGGARLPAYPGAKEDVSRALVLPYIIYRGEVFRADQNTAGARLLKTPDYEIDVGFGGSLGASNKEVVARAGMPSLGTSLEFGPRLKWNISKPSADSKLTFALPLRTVLEFKGGVKQRGLVIEPELSYDVRNAWAGWGINLRGSALYGNARLQNYLYGVAPQYATTTRNAYLAKSGFVSTRLGVAASRSLSPDSTIAVFARWDHSGAGANKDSPLHLKNNGLTVGVGITYTFWRSGTAVAD
jgi:MipA family protein